MPIFTWFVALTLFLGLLRAPAQAEPYSDALFDGSEPSSFVLAERLAEQDPSPPAKGPLAAAPAEPSEALLKAGMVWNNDAQIAKLQAAHPDPRESFRMAVIGDSEPGRFPWQRIFAPTEGFKKQVRRIHGMGPDFMVQLGDIVSKGVEGNYLKLVEFLDAEVTLPMLSVIGNHDRSTPNGDADKRLWRVLFGRTDFFFDHNGWRFIVLDSADRKLVPGQLAFLKKALGSGMPSLVFTHVPPEYLRGKLVSPEPEDKAYNMSGYFDEGSEEFRALVAAGNVRRVYMGHIHSLGTVMMDGVGYVLTGGGGSPLYPLPPGYPKRKKSHFIEVELGPDDAGKAGVRETVHELDGDSYELSF